MLPHSFLLLLMLYAVCAVDIKQPPRVSKPPSISEDMARRDVIYFTGNDDETVTLPCKAVGSRPIEFEWTKNGDHLNINDLKYRSEKTNRSRLVSVSANTGTLMIVEPVKEDEGFYQCYAKNRYGTSLSRKLHVIQATIGVFTGAQKMVVRHRAVPAMSLKLPCNPPVSNPPAKTRWVKYKNYESEIQYVEINERVALDDEGNLHFANVQAEDENEGQKYACMTEIELLDVLSRGFFSYIEVLEGNQQTVFPADLVYYSQPDTVVGLVGKSVSFKCIFVGNPTPTTTWERIDGKLEERMVVTPHELTIRKITAKDKGKYRCKGKNSVRAQPQMHTFTLIVESEPMWEEDGEPKDAEVGVEETATFNCRAKGNPKPNVEWFINGNPLANEPENSRRSLVDGVLTFRDLSLEKSDPKVIQCNVSNQHGYKWADVALSILAYKPEIKVPLTTVKVAEGSVVTLPCHTDGKPTPNIYWKKGPQKPIGDKFKQGPTGNLTIENVDISDGGEYTCLASNKYGKANATGMLIVRRKTRIVSPPYPKSQELRHKSPLEFTCSATTDSEEAHHLTITWEKDGEPVDLRDPRYRLTAGRSLVIDETNSTDTGNYTCIASNGLDSANASAELKIIAPPDPPHSVNFKTCRARNAEVTWIPGRANYNNITKYIVQYNHSYSPDVWTQGAEINDPARTQARISISPYANYTFRVIAYNQIGASEPSERSMAMCEANGAAPDSNPKNVRTIRDKPEYLIVEWDVMPEIEHNADEFKYVLSIKGKGKTQKFEISDWKVNRREIHYEGSIYEPFEVYVVAKNSVGECSDPAFVHIGYTGEGEPKVKPENFEIVPGTEPSPTSAFFQWDPVDTTPAMMKGEFHGYKIVFWKTEDPENSRKEVKVSGDNSGKRSVKETAEVKNLPPFSDLEAQVFAVNTYYKSAGSNIINITTPEGVPGPVKNCRVRLRGAHHFVLEWDKPESPNGILTGYEVGYKEIRQFEIGDLQSAEMADDPDTTELYLGGLQENQEYRIFVWAKTQVGRGAEHFVDAKTASPGPIARPEIKLALIGEDFVNVTWKVPKDAQGPAGSLHSIKIRKAGASTWIVTETEQTATWANVSGLTSATEYEIVVVASSGQIHQTSELITFRTNGTRTATVKEENSFVQGGWFIGMMVALAVLVLILFIVCIVKRSRGEKYHVQERERLRGTDPEVPEKDHFNEFPQSKETDPLAGSPDSFDYDPEKGAGGSETDSMAEYGGVDPSKFNEDGSFIGQYGGEKTAEPNAPSAMSTFV